MNPNLKTESGPPVLPSGFAHALRLSADNVTVL